MTESTKLKIAQVIDDTLDSTDGVQQIVLAVGAWLAEQGHEVHYITSSTTRTQPANIHSIAGNMRFKFNGNRVGIPKPASRSKVKQLLAEQDFDVVHVQVPYSPLLAGRVISALPERTALVGTFMILPLSRASRWGGKLLGLCQRRQVKRYDQFLALSAPASDFSQYMYGRPATPVGSPVDVEMYGRARAAHLEKRGPATNDQPVKILFLGRLVERKGAGALLAALVEAKKLTDVPFEVEIAGTGPLGEQYRTFAKENGLGDQVSFTGFIEEQDKAGLLAGADIIALPALGGESFGISVVEALAAGSGTVLAGDNAGYSSTIGPLTECLVNPRNISEFARTLVKHIEDPALRDSFSAKQVARAGDFAPDVVGRKIITAYEQALTQRKSGRR